MSCDIPVPSWIFNIKNDILRREFINVWKRLPDYIRPALMIDTPGVHLVDDQDTVAKARVAGDPDTGQTVLHMLFRRDLLDDPPAVIRASISHELAHVYLRHLDHRLRDKYHDLPPEVAEYFEWHANFVARHLFWFDDDYQARNVYLAEHPELDEVRHGA